MSRTLISIALIIDINEDEYPGVIGALDEAVREHLTGVLRKHGISAEELGDMIEYYGAHLHPKWELSEYLGEATA